MSGGKESNMKRILATGLGFFMIVMFSPAGFCTDGPYISGHIGYVNLQDRDYTWSSDSGMLEYDSGFTFGVAGGYRFKQVRVEAEGGYQKNDVSHVSVNGTRYSAAGDIRNDYLLINGYFDFVNKSPFTPFISAGFGVSSVRLDIHGNALIYGCAYDTVFTYQFGAGVGYALNKRFFLDLKYRYFATADPDLGGLKTSYKTNNVLVGVRCNF